VLTDANGQPTTIIGNGGWGKPSAASASVQGALKWRFDGDFQVMDTPVFVGTPEHGIVLVGNLAFDSQTGARVPANPCKCGAVGSADFDGDGMREILQVVDGEMRIMNESGNVVAKRAIDRGTAGTPLVSYDPEPFVIVAGNNELSVYDRELKPARRLRTPDAMPWLQPVAATVLDDSVSGAVAVLATGRGGWHRSVLYIFAASDQLVYMEILGDDYGSIASNGTAKGTINLLVGGRGEIWSYQVARESGTNVGRRSNAERALRQ